MTTPTDKEKIAALVSACHYAYDIFPEDRFLSDKGKELKETLRAALTLAGEEGGA